MAIGDKGVDFRNHEAKKPEIVIGCGMSCPRIASHEKETRQLRRRRPASNTSLCFVVDQTLALERFGPIGGERGGDLVLVTVGQCRAALWA